MLTAAADAETQRMRARMSQAWHTAMLGRIEKIPPLADLLGEDRAPQSEARMIHEMQRWAAASSTQSRR